MGLGSSVDPKLILVKSFRIRWFIIDPKSRLPTVLSVGILGFLSFFLCEFDNTQILLDLLHLHTPLSHRHLKYQRFFDLMYSI